MTKRLCFEHGLFFVELVITNKSIIMSKFNTLINSNKPVLVDFYATWCGPCKTMGPILEKVKSVVSDTVTILKVDVDKNPTLAAQYQVRGVPTLLIFKDGKIKWRQSGVVSDTELIGLLKQMS